MLICTILVGEKHITKKYIVPRMSNIFSDSSATFTWWLVKVVTRARVRFQIRIFFITSLLRH